MRNRKLIVISILAGLAACTPKSNEQLLAEATQSVNDGNYQEGLIILRNVAQASPRDAQIRSMLGYAYFHSGQLTPAEKELNLASDYGAPVADWLPLLIQINYLSNEFDIARSLWEKHGNELEGELAFESEFFAFLASVNTLSREEVKEGFSRLAEKAKQEGRDKFATLASVLSSLFSDDLTEEGISSHFVTLQELSDQYPKDWLIKMLTAKFAASSGDDLLAAKTYDEFASLMPKYDVPEIMAAKHYIQAGEIETAIKKLNVLTKQYPQQPYVHQLLAKASAINGDLQTAHDAILAAISRGLDNEETSLIAGLTYFKLGRYEQAYDHLSAIRDVVSEDHPAIQLLIATQSQLGYSDEALATLSNQKDSANQEVAVLVAQSLMKDNQREAALHALRNVKNIDSMSESLLVELGRLSMEADPVEGLQAIPGLEQQITQMSEAGQVNDPETLRARALLLKSLVAEGKVSEAEDKAQEWIDAEPESLLGYLLMVEVKKMSRDTDAVNSLYEKMLEINPQFVTAKLYFAAQALMRGEYQSALEQYESLIETAVIGKVNAVMGKYYALRGMGETQKAESFLAEVAEDEETIIPVRMGIAVEYLSKKKFDNVISTLNPVNQAQLSSYPNMKAKFHRIMATAYIYENRPADALTHLNSILNQNPKDGQALLRKIRVLDQLQRYEEAEQAIVEFQAQFEQSSPTLDTYLASYMNVRGDFKTADQLLKKHEGTSYSEHPTYLITRGKNLAGLRKYKAAQDYLDKAYAAAPNSDLARARYDNLMRLGKPEEAIRHLQQHLESHQSDWLMTLVYADHLSRSDQKAAVEPYKKVLEQQPDNLHALNNLAWLHHQLGETEEARKLIDKALQLYPENKHVKDTAFTIYQDVN